MAPIDVQTPLPSEFAKDADMRELIDFFLGELPKRVQILEMSLQAGNVLEIERIAHQLKGAAGGYGYPIITDAAAELERSAKAKAAIETLESEVRAIAKLCARARMASTEG